ncbi:MAG: hypothetical protein H0T48_07880 [Gemmatimonadaceae bacterium]|nr:hypothetical protein [Gemmatimonadaceae bacterium]
MPDAPLTISALGGLETETSGFPASQADRDKLLRSLRETADFAGLAKYNLGERLLDFLAESLRKPVADVMGEVWRQRKELRDVAKKGEDKRDVEGNVELFDHAITWELHPSVELQANGVQVGPTLTFDVKAELKLDGVELIIKNAWITRINAGRLTSTISLECKTIPLMAPCKKTIDLPQHLDLPGGGIRLGGEPRVPAAVT